jgi:hypothetical protein
VSHVSLHCPYDTAGQRELIHERYAGALDRRHAALSYRVRRAEARDGGLVPLHRLDM